MENWISFIESTAMHQWVLSPFWLWPTLEIIHFIGLYLLLGSILIIDFRLIGLLRGINVNVTHKLLPLAFVGFGLNLVSGVLFYIGDPGRYSINAGFQLKMALVLLAGINAFWFWRKISPVMPSWAPHGDTPGLAKLIGFVSLGSWFGVLLLGRLIPYVSTG